MAEIRIPTSDVHDWRSMVKEGGISGEREDEKREGAVRKIKQNELVLIEGIEYWFEPDRGSCISALNLPWTEIGSFGAAKSIVNFYDYHKSTGSPDAKKKFLETFQIASTEETRDGARLITWKNCCTKSFRDIRTGLYDYLETFVWPKKCAEIVTGIDAYTAHSANITEQELSLHDIIIGRSYFNDLFYLTASQVADALLTRELKQSILDSINSRENGLSGYTKPDNALIAHFDEAERLVFRACLNDNQFSIDSWYRWERQWCCSPNDLQTRILPLILFISNWSVVLGAYLTVEKFGSAAFTIGE